MTQTSKVRIDKWLWAARFYKSRSLSTAAVDGGHIHVNGERVKPSRAVAIGECVEITKKGFTIEVAVLALADRRGSAAQAQLLYQETESSQTRRALITQQRTQFGSWGYASQKRPDRRDRRRIRTLLGKD